MQSSEENVSVSGADSESLWISETVSAFDAESARVSDSESKTDAESVVLMESVLSDVECGSVDSNESESDDDSLPSEQATDS